MKRISVLLLNLNELLVQQSPSGPYFLGSEYSLADIAIAPFVARIKGFNKLFLDGYEFEALKKLPRLAEFFDGITNRPSFKETYCGDQAYIDILSKKFNITKQ
jgi:glutathione S-transferase